MSGNSELGIETKFKNKRYPILINLNTVSEMHVLYMDTVAQTLVVGGAITLTKLETFLTMWENTISNEHVYLKKSSITIRNMLHWFASTQIRNVASLAGNIATASPISDMNPILLALGASLQLGSSTGTRVVPLSTFFQGYRKVDLNSTEIILKIMIPMITSECEHVVSYKQAKRREDDISIVTGCFYFQLSRNNRIEKCVIGLGGMGPTSITLPTTAALLTGKSVEDALDKDVLTCLANETTLPVNVPGGMREYRNTLVLSFYYKAVVTMALTLQPVPSFIKDPRIHSAAETFLSAHRPASHGFQEYSSANSGGMRNSKGEEETSGKDRGVVGKSIMHASGPLQVSGEAEYTDDITPAQCIYGELVLSTIPKGTLVKIDATDALKSIGVVGFFDASDVKGKNAMGAVIKDEECFVTKEVTSIGQALGIVVADTLEHAQTAAKLVHVTYNISDEPPLFSIDDAIAANSFYKSRHSIKRNVQEVIDPDWITVTGSMYVGGQEHFYLETNSTVCIPKEGGCMEVWASTQAPTKTQMCVASVLDLPGHSVVCHVKRMGGGFGGKETKSVWVSCAAAVASSALQLPVKVTLDRHVDMATTGTRHAFKGVYTTWANKQGIIQRLELELFCNAGYSLDLSESVMDRALFHCTNAYYVPSISVIGICAKTNIASNTAFRGFGGPQGMLVAETYMEHVAHTLGLEPDVVRERNLYKEGQCTPYGQKMNDTWPTLWDTAKGRCDWLLQKQQVQEYNNTHRWRKRGLSIIPVQFGIAFTAKFMNQGGALVHIYTDGSVLVTHGGTEMGQGLHTKVLQVVARALEIPLSAVRIDDTSTDKIPNTSPSAASMSTDLYAMAALQACEILLERLQPIRATMSPSSSFETVVSAAYFARVSLSATGFYITPGDRCGYDWNKDTDDNACRGQPFNYYTSGVGVTQVEVDVLTGDVVVQRVDLCMDLGNSLNPALDIGQIEGAYLQGLGLFTMEEIVIGDPKQHAWVKPGQFFTTGPGTYKIPSANDVPLDFRIHLPTLSTNPYAVHSSRAVGEPPLFLASSAFFAIQHATAAARKEDVDSTGDFLVLASPLTAERTRMACEDHLMRYAAPDGHYVASGSF